MGVISVRDAIITEERNINVYISQSQELLLKAAWKGKNVNEMETPKECKRRMRRKRTEETGLESSCMGSSRERERICLLFQGIG